MAAVASLAAVWEIAARSGVAPQRIFPGPSSIVSSLISGLVDGTITYHGLQSLRRLAVGLALALAVGVALGLLLGVVPIARQAVYPLVKFIYPIPVAALVPVILVVTGITDALYVTIVTLGTSIPILIATVDAVRNLDPILPETGATLGASQSQLFLRVLIPAILPRIVHAMYVAFAIGLIVLITAEILVSTRGLGNVLVLAQRQFRVADMYAGVLAIGLIGMALSSSIRWLGRMVAGWEAEAFKKEW